MSKRDLSEGFLEDIREKDRILFQPKNEGEKVVDTEIKSIESVNVKELLKRYKSMRSTETQVMQLPTADTIDRRLKDNEMVR